MSARTQVLLPWQNQLSEVWIVAFFTWFGTIRLESLPQAENFPRWTEIFYNGKNWQPKRRGFLRAWRNLIFEMGSKHWNTAAPNALVYTETMLKNKNSSTKVRHSFLVHSENFSNHLHRFLVSLHQTEVEIYSIVDFLQRLLCFEFKIRKLYICLLLD